MTIKISIDAMGGDYGLASTIPAVLEFLRNQPDVEFFLVGREDDVKAALASHQNASHDRITIVNTTQIISMDDPIEVAMRKKRDSSMRGAIELVKSKTSDACVSGGNTGALLAISRYVLGTLPSVSRPAICMYIPNNKDGATYMLDLGANVDCDPGHLQQFARMAHVLLTCTGENASPSIGLLNVGSEDIKGNSLVKKTALLLREDHDKGLINFYGNVEGKDIFEGTTDIVVCDGFVGNIALKVIEGSALFFVSTLKRELTKGLLNSIGAFLARNGFKTFGKKLKPSRYNGGNLLGLRGLVFKSHGSADAEAFYWAIKRAYDSVQSNVLSKLTDSLMRTQGEEAAAAVTNSAA